MSASQSVCNYARTSTAPHLASQTDVSDSEGAEINPTQVLTDTAALENYFQDGFVRKTNNDEGEESDDGEDEQEGLISENEDSLIVDNPKTRPALAWADKFILEMRRKGGRQTENSVLRLWKVRWKPLQKLAGHPYMLYLYRYGLPMR